MSLLDNELAYQAEINLDGKPSSNRRIILMGRSRCGKTTLIRRMHDLDMEYHKTQAVEIYSDAIDTPGEFIDTPFFRRAAITTACDAQIVGFVHDCGSDLCRLPQMFSLTFAKPVIGIITKADTPETDTSVAENFLRNAGARRIVVTSALTGRGIKELLDLIATIDLTDY